MMNIRNRHLILAGLAATLTFVPWSRAEPPDFARDVRPILSDKCFYCHGPDEHHREADLRLDVREEAEYVFESELIDRITSDDPDYMMPPPASKLTLTGSEQQTLKAWIENGAPYARHWAFEPLPDDVPLPDVHHSDWALQPFDQFVMARLESSGLQPNPPAPPERWLRRVTLDLTGLPPTAEEIQAFLDQCQREPERAYEEAVARLLNSSAFGEHMAVKWLDLARYADSYGYQSDKLNTQWPYRDWVIRAFNQNLPYDQFLTWQLAGDLLPNPTPDQRLATAFNRIHRLNNEGGAVFEEWRIENVADRVQTFGTAILGLTLECCRCHDHKYDPFTMRDYYSLSAFFNSIDESGVYDRSEKVPCPSMLLPTEEQAAKLESAKCNVDHARHNYAKELERARSRYADWLSTAQEKHVLAIPDLRLAISFDEPFSNELKEIYHPSESDRRWTQMPPLVAVTQTDIHRMPETEAMDLSGDDETKSRERLALSLDGERGITTHGVEPFDRWLPFTVVMTFKETQRVPQRSLLAHHTRGTDCGYNGWDLTVVDGFVESRLYRVWPGNAIGVRTVQRIPKNQWHQLAATYDGSSRAKGLKLFLNGKELPTVTLRDNVKKSANVKVDHGGEFVVGQRFRARGLAGGLIDDVRVYLRDLTQPELQHLATGEPIDSTFEFFVSAVDEPARMKRRQLQDAWHEFVLAEEVIHEIPIMQELDTPREAHILARGRYDAPTDDSTRVTPDVIQALPIKFPDDAPRNRLGLARWVTDPSHPLTARVAVNHFWSNFFADALVRTPENFGLQGELPTHRGLLDWLARDFIRHGWDVKRLCRQIVLSATYRQDSRCTPDKLKVDPSNRLLARGPAHRLSAEQLRDSALAASGLLSRESGGPPVSPYQPGQDLWREANGMSPAWKQSVGKDLYRRSVYSVWKRTVPLPNMMAFDATTREVCTVKRSRTNTPLQALVLLNDVQFVEAARVLAQNVLKSGSETGTDRAFLQLTGRRPDATERTALLRLYRQERDYFRQHPDAAAELIRYGETPVPPETSEVDLAAMTVTCQAIMNLDAAVWKR